MGLKQLNPLTIYIYKALVLFLNDKKYIITYLKRETISFHIKENHFLLYEWKPFPSAKELNQIQIGISMPFPRNFSTQISSNNFPSISWLHHPPPPPKKKSKQSFLRRLSFLWQRSNLRVHRTEISYILHTSPFSPRSTLSSNTSLL